MIDDTTAMTQATASVEPVSSADPALNTTTAAAQPAAAAYPVSPGWPGPNWPQVQPSAELPLQGLNLACHYPAGLLFDAAGSRVVVVETRQRFWTWNNLTWHAPDLALLAITIAFVWLLRRLYSNLRADFDPRIVGHWYCRKCVYDLTPPDTDLRSRVQPGAIFLICPECGTQTAKRRPRRAKRKHVSIFWPLTTMICVIGAAAYIFDRTLEPAPSGPSAVDLWPSPLLSQIFATYLPVPLLQRCDHYADMPDAHLLSVYELPSGRLLARELSPSGWGNWQITDDGAWCVGITYDNLREAEVRAMNLKDAAPRLKHFALPAPTRMAPLRNPRDAQSLFFSDIARADGAPWFSDDASDFRSTVDVVVRICRLDPVTGEWTALFNIPHRLARPAPPHSLWLVVEPGKLPSEFTAVLQQFRQARTPAPESLDVFSILDGKVHMRHIVGPAGSQVSGFVPGSNGTRVQVYMPSGGVTMPGTLDLTTDTFTVDQAQSQSRISQTPDGLLTLQYPAIPARLVDPDGQVAAVLCSGSNWYYPTLHDKGRWAWAEHREYWPPYWLNNLVGYRFRTNGHLVIWDLDPVKQRIRAAKAPQEAAPTKP